jgi:hypothetical protein
LLVAIVVLAIAFLGSTWVYARIVVIAIARDWGSELCLRVWGTKALGERYAKVISIEVVKIWHTALSAFFICLTVTIVILSITCL